MNWRDVAFIWRLGLVVIAGLGLQLAAASVAEAAAEEAAAHGGGGPIEFKADLGIYTLIAFIILAFLLTKAGWRPMLQAIEARERQIAASVAQATELKQEAERLLAEHRQRLAGAEAEVRAILEEARQRAERLRAELLAQAREEAERLRQQAEEDIARARDAALEELFERAAELVADVTARILPRQLSEEDHRQLVRQALEELSTTHS